MSKNFEETRTIYSANKPEQIFMGSNTDYVIARLFDTLLQRFQQSIETSNDNASGFNHENVALLHYDFQKIDIVRAESYIKSPNWLVNKGATVSPKHEKDNKCFQYSITLALNHNKTKNKDLQKILKLKPSDIGFSPHQEGWENFEQNNTSIAVNVLFVLHTSKEIKLAYKSRYYNERENHAILLMINGKAKRCYIFL